MPTPNVSAARLDAINAMITAQLAAMQTPEPAPSTFPSARLDAMRAAASSFDPRAPRLDSLSESALGYLDEIDPTLAFFVQTANTAGVQRRKDASESLFFVQQLAHIRAGLLEVLYPNLRAKEFIPLEGGIDPGAEYFEYHMQDGVGRAQLIKDYGDDLPSADVRSGADIQVIRGAGLMYRYTMQELRAAIKAGLPLDVRKAMMTRRGMAILADEVLFFGHADVVANQQSATGKDAGALNAGLQGFANFTGKYAVLAFTTPTGGAGSQLWRLKSPDEKVRDLHKFANNIMSNSSGIHVPDSMIMGTKAFNDIATTRMGDGSNQTVLSFFLATNPYIKNVDWSYRLDPAASPNWNGTSSVTTGRIIAYEKNPERGVGLLPVEFEQLAPENRGFETRTLCHARMGGCVPLYPKSFSYMDNCTDAND